MLYRFLKNLSSLLLSLVLATLVWIAAVREQNPPREADYERNIPVEVMPPAAGLVTTDKLPERVRLRLLAPESSWATLTPSKFKVLVDLSKLPAGFNDVPIQVNVSDAQIKIVDQNPKVVTVNLQAEQTISLPVTIEIMDGPPLGYVNKAPLVDPKLVTVTGPASLISQVDQAISEIFIRNSRETIKRSGDVFLHNWDDQVINGLKINPITVHVTLPIEQRFGYKDVSVSAVVEGQAAPGYWVSNIAVDPPRLTIVGHPRVLGSIPGFIETAPINVRQATADIVRTVPLNLPDGVTVVMPEKETEGASGVQVTIEVEAIESGQTVQRPVIQQGIDPNYIWTASPERADVILSGPIPRLQTLGPNDVEVIVDLFGLRPGTYNLRPTVFLPDDLRVEAILPDTIEITISLNLRATPTRIFTPTSTITATSSISANSIPPAKDMLTPPTKDVTNTSEG